MSEEDLNNVPLTKEEHRRFRAALTPIQDLRETLDQLLTSWEGEVEEFATHNDGYYNAMRQCIDDLRRAMEDHS